MYDTMVLYLAVFPESDIQRRYVRKVQLLPIFRRNFAAVDLKFLQNGQKLPKNSLKIAKIAHFLHIFAQHLIEMGKKGRKGQKWV